MNAAAGRAILGMSKAPFRETLWFKKGEIDPPPTQPLEVIEDSYVDDGSVTLEDNMALSVRTGTTQAIEPIGDAARQFPLPAPADEGELDAGDQLQHIVVHLKRGRLAVLAAIGASAAVLIAAVALLA